MLPKFSRILACGYLFLTIRETWMVPFMRSEGLYLEAIIASLLATGAVKSCGDSSLLCDRS
jgi:hypothetical protein